MEELSTTVAIEGTVPQDLGESNTTEVSTETTEQSATSAQDGTEETENTSELAENGEQQSAGTEDADSAVFISIPHNHEMRDLSRAETVDFLQTGIHAKPLLADLRYLAAQEGMKSVKDFIDKLKTAANSARMENIKSQLVDDGNAELLESIVAAEQQKFREAAGLIEADEQKAFASEYETEHSRLADEFIALQKEFPEFGEFKDLPQSVLRIAQKEKISLLDAHLRFMHAENKKIKKAEQSQAAAKESSTGSMQSETADTSSALSEAMRAGVWR